MTLALPPVQDPTVQAALNTLAQQFPISTAPASVGGMLTGRFHAYRANAHAPANGNTIVWDTEMTVAGDVSGWYDAGTGQYTPKVPGVYRFAWYANTSTAMTVDKYMSTALRKNGTNIARGTFMNYRTAATGAGSFGYHEVDANGTSDVFDVILLTDNGTALTLYLGVLESKFQGGLVGRL